MELLRLADQKRKEHLPLTKISVRPVELSPVATTPQRITSRPEPVTPPTQVDAAPAATPQTESFFGRMFSALRTSIFASPKPARPATATKTPKSASTVKSSTPIASPVVGELTMTLTPTPTSVGQSRGSSKYKQPSKRRERAAIARNVASSIPDKAEQHQALQWAENILKQVLQDPSGSTDEKRRRLEEGMTYGELNHINSKPWKTVTSSFSLDDELMDHVDDTPDEPAPMWAVLEHLRIEMEERDQNTGAAQTQIENEVSLPSAKKQKTSRRSSQSVLTKSPAQTTPLDHTKSPFFNSGGRTTSLRDLHPRSALDRGSTPKNNNIFRRSQQQSESKENTPPSAFPTSFTVPDDSDDEEDVTIVPASPTPVGNGNVTPPSGRSATWTQPPPPAPVMTHAELPASVGPTPSVPSVDGNLVSTPATPAVDRVEAQRARALKFTPHKPSNLSHMSKPSPSLRSDAGDESIVADSPAPINLFGGAASTSTPSIFQSKGLTNGTSLFQNKGLSNGTSPLPAKSLTNGTSLFQSPAMTNGASPAPKQSTSKDTPEPQIKGASKLSSSLKSATPSSAPSDFGIAFPDAEPLDLPSDLEADISAYAQSAELKAKVRAMAWDDPILEYDE